MRTFFGAVAVAAMLAVAGEAGATSISLVYQCPDSAPGYCTGASDGNDSAAIVNAILTGEGLQPRPVQQLARFDAVAGGGWTTTGNADWFSVTGPNAQSGSFSFLGDDTPGVSYLLTHFAVKAGPGFLLFSIDNGSPALGVTSATNIAWSTLGLVVGRGNTPGLSHITFYGTSGEDVTVPEPASLMLLGVGLLGLAARVRRS